MANINLSVPSFLKSTRFWELAVVALIWVLLEVEAVVNPDVVAGVKALAALLVGSAGVRTVDRFAEKVGK